ncbi:MAG: hypothetical protein LBN23_05350 [Paludibacter sp.]|nr:hypothetical protein [Paludibacter sp.]
MEKSLSASTPDAFTEKLLQLEPTTHHNTINIILILLSSNMNKIFSVILLLLIVFSVGCEPKTKTMIDSHYIVNHTDKQIVHEVIYRFGQDDISVYVCNAQSVAFEFEWEKISAKHINQLLIVAHKYANIYCINDTSSKSMIPLNDSIKESNFYKYVSKGQETDKNEIIYRDEYYLTVTDSLVNTFHKDYNMLDKLSKYYVK